jgi:hypothetical protein
VLYCISKALSTCLHSEVSPRDTSSEDSRGERKRSECHLFFLVVQCLCLESLLHGNRVRLGVSDDKKPGCKELWLTPAGESRGPWEWEGEPHRLFCSLPLRLNDITYRKDFGVRQAPASLPKSTSCPTENRETNFEPNSAWSHQRCSWEIL